MFSGKGTSIFAFIKMTPEERRHVRWIDLRDPDEPRGFRNPRLGDSEEYENEADDRQAVFIDMAEG